MCTKSQNPGKITKIRALSGRFSTNARISGRTRIYPGDLVTLLIYWAGVPILNHFPCLVQIWTKFRILDLIEATVECGNIYFWRFWYNFCCWKILVWPPSISAAFPRIRVRESRWNRCLVATLLSLPWTQHPGLFSAQLLLPL